MLRCRTKWLIWIAYACIFHSCGILMVPPAGVEQQSIIGEITATEKDFIKLPTPQETVVVGVYKFRDQTGQYKPSATGANWSTAIPQGLTTILIKSLEDSRWFVPIERENIGNLLNERQLIRSTRQEFAEGPEANSMPPLLFAGILLEGGVVSYDTNILTGGAGARYFGVGGSTEYRQDRITVYLRAVSTSSGKILKTIYTSKTILSQSINASMFRYVDVERLMEAEVGVTNNEPVHMAVTEAINKAVYMLILEGIRDGLWSTTDNDQAKADVLLQDYTNETVEAQKKVVGKGYWENNRRAKLSIGAAISGNTLRGDFPYGAPQFGTLGNISYALSDYFNLAGSYSYQKLGWDRYFQSSYTSVNLDLEYFVLPFNSFTPYLTGGMGTIENINNSVTKIQLKSQFGAGIEYLASPAIGIRGFTSYHVGFNDDWDEMISGKRKDHFLQFGLGIQIYLGK